MSIAAITLPGTDAVGSEKADVRVGSIVARRNNDNVVMVCEVEEVVGGLGLGLVRTVQSISLTCRSCEAGMKWRCTKDDKRGLKSERYGHIAMPSWHLGTARAMARHGNTQ